MSTELIKELKQEIGGRLISEVKFQSAHRIFLRVPYNNLRQTIMFFKRNSFFQITAISGTQTDDKSIELLYHLDKAGTLVTIRVLLPPRQDSIPTITDIISGASLYEREIHDLFGIKFEGHPDLSKLVLPDEWKNDSYPLRT